MIPKRAQWCAMCYLRIAAFEACTVYRRHNYHQDCFLKLVKQEAEQEKKRRLKPTLGEEERETVQAGR